MKENPDPIHHTQTVQTGKHKMTRTPAAGCENWDGIMVNHPIHVYTKTGGSYTHRSMEPCFLAPMKQ